MNMADRYRKWFEYEKDSYIKVLASFETVPQDARGSEKFQKAVMWLAHLIAARNLWLYRFGVKETAPTLEEFFPENLSPDEVKTPLNEMQNIWTEYLSRLDDNEIARVFEYKSFEGDLFQNSIDDILTQLHGHSLYHRGHISSLIRDIGGVPTETDYVFWTRKKMTVEKSGD